MSWASAESSGRELRHGGQGGAGSPIVVLTIAMEVAVICAGRGCRQQAIKAI